MTTSAVTQQRLHVLVIDDSAVARHAFRRIFAKAVGIELETAADALIARRKIAARRPDAIVLDLALPHVHGLDFLRELMSDDPIPVVVCSASAQPGSEVAFRALEEGAIDLIAKPALGVDAFFERTAREVIELVRTAAGVRLRRRPARERPASGPARRSPLLPQRVTRRPELVVIGASTGGPKALGELIARLERGCPPVAVVQHMPDGFTGAFARRLDTDSTVQVREARHGDRLEPGLVLIAPGSHHLAVERRANGLFARVHDGDPVSGHRPSVDVLFRSASQSVGVDALGLLLTGMGSDGAQGLLELRRLGADTIAEAESSCAVFGMPQRAIELGAAARVLPLEQISELCSAFAPAS
jgi:two-component system, chemotaxis family, protein-glutamate methylesterase/glutaminase